MSDNDDAYAIAASMAARWLSAYHAKDTQARDMLDVLASEPRGLALAFTAMGDMCLSLLTELDKAGVLEGGIQVWLDRAALGLGAASDEVIKRHRGEVN